MVTAPVNHSMLQVVQFVEEQRCMVATHLTLDVITWLSVVTSLWIMFIFCGQMGLVAGETTTYQVHVSSVLSARVDVVDVAGHQASQLRLGHLDGTRST